MPPLMYDATRYTYDASPLCAYRFTGKERDGESGLDNFGTRYDSSSMGRFMSPDDLGLGQHPENPQSWNLYSYVTNNPLTLIDPTGQYVCDSATVTHSQCDNFQKGLDQAQTAANNLKDKYGADSSKYQDAQRAIDAYGKEGVDNGVTIAQGNVGSGEAETQVAGSTVTKTADNPNGQNIRVTFDKSSNLLSGADAGSLGGLGAHEGVHVADASDWVSSGFSPNANPSSFQTEMDAYRVEASIGEGLGAGSMGLSFGKRDINFSLPLNAAGSAAIGAMIRRQYPKYNLDAFSRNTKITRP
jgi:RHS repeat-associated protein